MRLNICEKKGSDATLFTLLYLPLTPPTFPSSTETYIIHTQKKSRGNISQFEFFHTSECDHLCGGPREVSIFSASLWIVRQNS